MNNLKEALIESGVIEKIMSTPKEKSWHQIFEFPVTRLEIPILVKVRCNTKKEGLKFIAGYNLNAIEADSPLEAQVKVNQRLSDIQYTMKGTDDGCPLYWKFIV